MRSRTEMIALRERTQGSQFSWLYGELRTAILNGRLAAGSRVPSTRRLAGAYHVARGTVVAVFEQLLSEGYVTSAGGSGTYVAESLPDIWFRASTPRVRIEGDGASCNPLSQRGTRIASNKYRWLQPSPGEPRPFRAHYPGIDAQSLVTWKRLSGRVALSDRALASPDGGFGYRPLREALAEHLARVRGFRCSFEQVMIVASVQQSLDLAARLLTDPGDAALLEDPGYPGARLVFEANGLDVRPLPVDHDGADIRSVGPDADRARLVYVTPTHQCPLGVTMSVRRRLELLAWASRCDAWILEDDYDSEYRFAGRPIAALAGLDEYERVIHSGALSKLLFPGLRLAYVVVPPSLIDAFAAARVTIDRYPPIQAQLVLHEFMAAGHFDRHLRRMRELYAERLRAFTELMDHYVGDYLKIAPTTTGLQTIGWLRSDRPDREVAKAAFDNGVEAIHLSRYRLARPTPPGLHLGFGAFDHDQLRDGAIRLRATFTAN